ncbi:GTPase-activating protein [Pleurotus pulmonarius]|nr:GTPase-activating protein [Pleurotus pulmonarius]
MDKSHTTVLEEKSALEYEDATKGFFGRRKKTERQSGKDNAEVSVNLEESVSTVTLSQLFRYSTRFELTLDAIGLPLMSLLFGNLVQAFVVFAQDVLGARSGNAEAAARVPQAAADFRRSAANNASYLVYIGLGMFVCTYIYMFTWVYTGEVNAKRIRELYLKAVLRQDIAWFDNTGAGEVATRIQTDTHLVQQGISEKVPITVSFVAALITGFVLAYIRCWQLALALSSILPCIAIAGGVMTKFVTKYTQASLNHVADSGTLAEEVISTIRTAQAFGSQKVLSEVYDSHVERSQADNYKSALAHGAGFSVFFFIVYSSYGLAFSFGTTLINSGHATPGEVINSFLAILIGSLSLGLLAPELQAITNARGSAAKLFATIDRVPDIDSSSTEGRCPTDVQGEIVFENVSFNYPSRPSVPVVRDLSIRFRAGETAALVGASGSGKSTIISLLERFYDPLSGIVKLDGINIKDLNIKWLRSQIGLVSQEPALFATTILENVAHGLVNTPYEHSTHDERFKLVREACLKANAHDFISKLPLGYDTLVGEHGFLLSGGQKQRVAIARAIVSDPRILLLDEATSALDTQSEGIVQDALDKATAGRTTIIVAHRLSTIKNANIIYVMGGGDILEQGTHDELMRTVDGAYAKLVRTQNLRDHAEEPRDNEYDTERGSESEEKEKAEPEDINLARKNTVHSLCNELAEHQINEDDDLSLYELLYRLALLNREGWRRYIIGIISAIMTGLIWPAFGIVYGKVLKDFRWKNRLSVALQEIATHYVKFFDQQEHNSGSLTSALSDNPQKVHGLAGITLGAIIQSISTIIGGSAIGLAFGWKLALVGIACTPILVSIGYIRLRIVVLKDQVNKLEHESSAQLACEAAGSIRTVASLTREHQSNKTALWSSGLYALSQSMTFFVIALVYWYGSRLVASQEYSTVQFFVCLMSTTFGAIQAGNVFIFVPDISSARGAGSAIIKLVDSTPEIDADSPEGKNLDKTRIHGRIRFEAVHFRYPTRPSVRVLRGLSLTIEPGTYVALVGASGCGKSTIVQLIERFYDPIEGTIHLDNERISELNIANYRQQVALVSQEPTLYADTIRFNILLGATKPQSDVTQKELEDACRNANILEFIQSLPNGFDTQVGGKGSQLSGGQKQRIAIARALLRNPKVLLLDEATSALDSGSESVVQEALDQAAKGRTTVAVAHRLSTIQNADLIYFIKEGRVSESGTHDQLLGKRGDYFEYVQLQVDPSDRFISITHLCWSVEVDDAVLFAAFLGSLPSLEYMIAGGDGIRFIPLAPAALPLLHHLVNASPDFAESVLTGRDVPNLGLVVNNVRLFAPVFDDNNEYDSSTLTTMKCVKSLSMSSDKLNCSLLMECASLFREVKYLKISPEAPLEAFAMPQLYDTGLSKTRVQSLELCAVCSDDAESNIESLKQLFSALPSLQTLVFRRVNGDSEDGFYRFCRDELDDGPEWNEVGESEETTEDDEWQI